jgi:hypothetical protein
MHLVCFVFLTCGATHLFSAYVVFNPIYVFDGAFKTFAGLIGAVCAAYVAHNLVTVYDTVEAEHRRLDLMEASLAGKADTSQGEIVKRAPRRRVLQTVMEGLGCAVALGLLLWLPDSGPVDHGLFRNNFGTQWTGTCMGWTKPLALLFVTGSVTTWASYVLMGWVVLRLHPISKRVRSAKVMVPVVGAVLATCGSVHLVEAYAIFNPIYVALGWLKHAVALVSLVGAVLVAQTLILVFAAVRKDRERLTGRCPAVC